MTAIPLALVGPGKIARDAHVPALAASASFRLVACVSDGNGLEGLPCLPSVAALRAAMPEVAAVAICTPPQIRGMIAHQAIAAGLHVLLEKPPTATVSECMALQDAAATRGTTVFAAWHSRFAPMVERAREWLRGRRITGGRMVWQEDVRVWHPGQAWLWTAGGLGVFDTGINGLSILTSICPEALAVRAARFTVPVNADTPIAAALTLNAAGAPIEVALDFRRTGTPCWSIDLQAGDDVLRLEDGGTSLTLPGEGRQTAAGAEYDAVYARFAALIGAGGSDCDAAPLRLVADAFMLAHTEAAEPFLP